MLIKLKDRKKDLWQKETILMSSLPFYLFKDENGDNVIDKSKEFELLMPYDNGIKKIDINVKSKSRTLTVWMFSLFFEFYFIKIKDLVLNQSLIPETKWYELSINLKWCLMND